MTGYIGIGNTAKKTKNIYIGVGGIAKKVKKGYIGVNGIAKLWYSSGLTWNKYAVIVDEGYNEVTGESTQYSLGNAFYAGSSYTLSQSTGQFTVNCDTQIAKSSDGATNAVGKYFVAVNDSFPSASGTYTDDTLYLITAASYNWITGLKITVTPYTSEYYSHTYRGAFIETVEDDDLTTFPINGIQDGYWYIFENEIAALSISYSGTYVDELVQMGDGAYRLVSLTGSGTFNIEQQVKADVWICGGGQGGYAYNNSSYPRHGGGGSYCQQSLGVQIQNLIATIGAAPRGDTSITGDLSLSVLGGGKNTSGTVTAGYGGSGGGGGTNDHYGVGDGLPKIPFADTYFVYPYCDGGGGGGKARNNKGSYSNIYGGGNAGINGGDGLPGNPSTRTKGTSGHYGGAGGNVGSTGYDGKNATGYGSAGGGGSYYDLIRDSGSENDWGGSGGSGYQGVCLIRIPLN